MDNSYIRLDQFLKWVGATGTGGQAKLLIAAGDVQVNGAVETRRGRKLYHGDQVSIGGHLWSVETLDMSRDP
ncbi:MAG: RNA-binding S4 domain-containing protein [Synechococcales cyanobacterium]